MRKEIIVIMLSWYKKGWRVRIGPKYLKQTPNETQWKIETNSLCNFEAVSSSDFKALAEGKRTLPFEVTESC